ncbi:gliding motility-associated C-terminal domain-containing protein [Hymenobacter sp. CRA2]|uniref:gliding motility-associated C-terminal domain-containing protein n=1 Tax=Hymenobacter sp. CRA2 TaxID=1955620 RepID=UPI00098F232C|nr:gliding motility-associated C-terminal domain-containing protein [Hymenobacter sp. CRA2]OON70501.1 hypothetical protein B0919_00255 [Hymenobacter sp. CRA2]
MKHTLRASLLLLAVWCLALFGAQQAYASHAQGGQLTYEYLRTNANGTQTYRITARYFRDCSGISAESSLPLVCRVGSPTTSCNSNDSRNLTATLVRGQLVSGTPYCSAEAGANQCNSSSTFPNYETAKYTADVDLPLAPEWTLSVQISARPYIENIGGNTTLRFEATLNNQLALANGQQRTVTNTSPQYQDQDIPIPFVCVSQTTTLTFSTFEPDGDSLVYSLERPLEGCNVFSTYGSISSQGGYVPAPEDSPTNPCAIRLPSGTTNYSPTYPIPSYATTGSCPIKQGTPYFAFNPQLGSITFTPSQYFPNTPSEDGKNKYSVVGKVTEYRLINGRYYKVGSVRRDMLVIIINCSGNGVPNAPVATGVTPGANPTIVNTADSTVISVYSCNYSQVRVRFTDPNPQQQLTVSIPQTSLNSLADIVVPNGYVLSGNGTTSPVAAFYFQPSPQLVGTTIRIPVRIEDNACPIKGVQNRIIVVKVLRGNFATAVAAANNASTDPIICYGTSIQLRGSVVRPDSVRNGLQTYSYTWAAANGLNPSDANRQNITVSPTQTTRYRLRIAPTTGYSPGLCGDTTSIRVRVAPQVLAAFRTDSAAVANGRFNRPPRVFTFVNQSRVNNVQTAQGIDSVRWTYQRVTDGKGQPVTESPVRFSGRFTPNALTLSQSGTYIIRLSVANTTPGVTCPASVAAYKVSVPDLTVPNIFTPNKDGMNDTFIVQAGQEGNKMEIFNRWGRKIKEYANYKNDWDGEGQPAGVYYYQITAQDGKVTKGWVELVR